MNEFVQALEETGAVFWFKGRGAAGYGAHVAQEGGELPVCQGPADGVLAEDPALGIDHPGTLLQAACCKRNICGYGDIGLRDMLCYPVISGIETVLDDDQLDKLVRGNPQGRIGNEINLQPIPLRNPEDLVLHRTGVCIYV